MTDAKKKYISSSLERQKTIYLSPKLDILYDAYVEQQREQSESKQITKSKVGESIIRHFFEQMPAEERSRLIARSKHSY